MKYFCGSGCLFYNVGFPKTPSTCTMANFLTDFFALQSSMLIHFRMRSVSLEPAGVRW